MRDLIRQETKDGEELVRFMLEVLRNEKYPIKYRLEAARWLTERGFGKTEPTGTTLLIQVEGLHVPGVKSLPDGAVDVKGVVKDGGEEGHQG